MPCANFSHKEVSMRKFILAGVAGMAFILMPQPSSAAPASTVAGIQTGAALRHNTTYYRRDYDYYGYGYYPRYRHYRYYDYGYYPRRHYYRSYYYRPYYHRYYRRYWY